MKGWAYGVVYDCFPLHGPFSHICVNMRVIQVAREVQLHSTLVHEGVIAMYAAWKDPTYVYMAIEWAAGVSIRRSSNLGIHHTLYTSISIPVTCTSTRYMLKSNVCMRGQYR